jgi:RHS repeat-associated protein
LNRLTKIEYDDGDGNPANNLQNTYAWDEISRLTSATNQAGTVGFTYDSRNRVQTTTDVFGKVLTYEYQRDASINQRRLKLDGTLYATYNFDDAENLSNIVNASDSSTISFQYDAEDKPTKRIYPNGVTTDYSYFDDDSLKEIKDYTATSTLFDRQYSYLNCVSDNQICQITEPGLTRSFTYDLADRLSSVTASNSQNESYNYGTVGNRTSSHLASSYTYKSGQFNQLETAVAPSQTMVYGYNANGAMTSRTDGSTTWQYTWDFENRMTSAGNGTSQVNYAYDALGRRISRNDGAQTTNFTYDGNDVLLDDVGGTQTKYLNGLGIDNKLRQTTGSTTSYFVADHLGSTNGLTDSTGALTASNSYDSFGNATNTSFPSRYQFTGRELDTTTGLQYNRARWYNPNIGRFISEDPIGFRGGDVNLYGYVRNNPTRFIDPRGLDIIVIENGRTEGNPFGHTAIGISGRGIISYGNGYEGEGSNIIGGSPEDYFAREASRRNTTIWVIRTSPEQDQQAFQQALDIDYFGSPLDRGGLLFDNCSIRSHRILDAAGIPNNNWLPDFIPGTVGGRAYDFGATAYFIPQGPSVHIVPGYSPDYDFSRIDPRY